MSAEDTKKRSTKPKSAIYPYLYFGGNASEAIDFYAASLGAQVICKIPFSQGGPPVPEEHKNCVMHSMIKVEESMMMISDTLGGKEGDVHNLKVGNNVTLNINWEDAEEMKAAFNKMAEGGTVLMPCEHQFWGATYGKLVDKFDVTWSFNCHDADHKNKKPRTDEA